MQEGLCHVERIRVRFDLYLGEPVFLQHVLDDPRSPEVGLVDVVFSSTVEEALEVSVSGTEGIVDAENGWLEVVRHSISILWEDSEDQIRLVNQECSVLRDQFLYSANRLVEVENSDMRKRLSQDGY